jgi:hypothetical protein
MHRLRHELKLSAKASLNGTRRKCEPNHRYSARKNIVVLLSVLFILFVDFFRLLHRTDATVAIVMTVATITTIHK